MNNKKAKFYTILKEPLLHFILIGGVIFFIYYQLNDSTSMEDKKQIHITKDNLSMLDAEWFKNKGREATAKEKQAQLENFIQEEILYREALVNDLDKNDNTIRIHLAKKMKFVLDDHAIIEEPTDAELTDFMSKNSSKFMEPAQISLNLVNFTQNEKSKNINQEAKDFLKRLQASSSSKVSTVGDLVELSRKGISNILGEDFTNQAFTLPVKSWQGPIKTKHGEHLIYIHSRNNAYLPELSKIRERVVDEWRIAKRDEANKLFYEKLQKDYEIIIDSEINK